MKRFTETTKWRDPWFRRLTPLAKLLWSYLTDNCNSVGLIDLDMEAAAFDIGTAGGEVVGQKHLDELVSRLTVIEGGKLFIPKFIPFQYGRLSVACPAHKPILTLIEQLHLEPTDIGYGYPSDRVAKGNGTGSSTKPPKEAPPHVTEATIPPALNTPAFLAVWKTWLDHLKQKRKSPTTHAVELQLKKLADMGLSRAIAAVEHSISKNYQGVYEDNANNKPTVPQGTRPPWDNSPNI